MSYGTKDDGTLWTGSLGVSSAVVTSADASTAVVCTDAPASGQKIVVTDIFLTTDTALTIDFEEETTATVKLQGYFAANTFYQITPRTPIVLDTADKKLAVKASGAGNIAVTVLYYSTTNGLP